MAKGNTGWFPHPSIGWFEPLLYELQFRIGVVVQKLRKARDLRVYGCVCHRCKNEVPSDLLPLKYAKRHQPLRAGEGAPTA